MPKPLILNVEGNALEQLTLVNEQMKQTGTYTAAIAESGVSGFTSLKDSTTAVTNEQREFINQLNIENETMKEAARLAKALGQDERNRLTDLMRLDADVERSAKQLQKEFDQATKARIRLDADAERSARQLQKEFDQAAKARLAAADSEGKSIARLTAYTNANRYATKEQIDAFKSMSVEAQELEIKTARLSRATETSEKIQRNTNKEFKAMFTQMGMNNLEVAHYAAMIDRMMGTHTGLATVFRSGFNPSLLGVGVALSVVTAAVHKYREHAEAMEKLTKEAVTDLIKYKNAVIDAAGGVSTLNGPLKEMVSLAKEFEEIRFEEKITETTKAIAYQEGYMVKAKEGVKFLGAAFWDLTKHGMYPTRQSFKDFYADMDQLSRSMTVHGREAEVLRKKLQDLHFQQRHGGRTLEETIKRSRELEDRYALATTASNKLANIEVQRAIALRDLAEEQKKYNMSAEDYAKGLAAINAEYDAQKKTSDKDHQNQRARSAIESFKRERDAIELMNANSEEKILIEERKHMERLNELARQMPEKYKEIQEMKLAYHREAAKKILAMDEDARNKTIKLMDGLNHDIVASEKKRIDDLNNERERAYDRYVNLVGNEEQKIARRVAKEKAEWIDLYNKRLISETQLHTALEAMNKREEAATRKRIEAEKKAKIQAAFATANAIIGIAELSKNKQVQKIGQMVGAIEKIYKAWETIHNAMALFRRTTDAMAAISAIKAGTSEKAAQAGMGSLEAQVNAFNSAAAIPMVGWMLAPGAMAAAAAATSWQSAAISAMGSAAAGAVGAGQAHKGMSFDRDGSYLMNVQKGETIVPNTQGLTDLSSAITSIAEAGEGGGHKTVQHFNFYGTVTDERRAGRTIAKMVSRAQGRYNVRA